MLSLDHPQKSLYGKRETRRYRIIDLSASTGRHPVMVATGIPLILPNAWASHLMGCVRPNTVRSYLYDVQILLEWADSIGIDLNERWRCLQGLTLRDIDRLRKCLEQHQGYAGSTVSSATFNRRIAAIVSYVQYCFDTYIDLAYPNIERVRAGQKRKESNLKQLRKLARGSAELHASARKRAILTEADFLAIKRISESGPELNPFTQEHIRRRNYCIVKVALETWARRAELTLLEVEHLQLGATPTITIKAPLDHVRLARRDGASLKTRGREVPITSELAALLSDYLEEIRPRFVNATKPSGALFLSDRDGQRLSCKSINGIFSAIESSLKKCIPGARFHPHALRTAAANHFRLKNDNHQRPYEYLLDGMTYLGGWSPRSRMPAHYAREAISDRLGDMVRKR